MDMNERGKAPQPGIYELDVVDNVPFESVPGGSHFALTLQKPAWDGWTPGQFVMLRPQNWGADMLWARPFSICRVNEEGLTLFIQAKGRGTERLRALTPGDKACLWGPLGKGFAVDAEHPTLLLAGGIGLAPFIGYAERHPNPAGLTLLFGHKSPERCYPTDLLKTSGVNFQAFPERCLEDREAFLAHIREQMELTARQQGLVLACGPQPFLKAIQGFAAECGAKTQISLEHRMACGIGACLGCVCTTTEKWPVPSKAGFPVQTCTQGPVFWSDQIVLE